MKWALFSLLLLIIIAAISLRAEVDVKRIKTTDKVVALTFDDGPNPPFTDEIAKELGRRKIHATFFLLGQNMLEHPLTVERLVREGHEIGNHSFSHPRFWWRLPNEIADEFHATDELIRRFGGRGMIPFRCPYGDSPWLVDYYLWRHHRKNVLFDVSSSPGDFTRPNPSFIVRSVLNKIHPGAIILLHDGEGTNAETVMALPEILDGLARQNYRVVTVSDLLNLKK